MSKAKRFWTIQLTILLIICIFSPSVGFAATNHTFYFQFSSASTHSIFYLNFESDLPADVAASGEKIDVTYKVYDMYKNNEKVIDQTANWSYGEKLSISYSNDNAFAEQIRDTIVYRKSMGEIQFSLPDIDGYHADNSHVEKKEAPGVEVGATESNPYANTLTFLKNNTENFVLKIDWSMRLRFGLSSGGTVKASGEKSGELTSGEYYPEQNISFTATPQEGYRVHGWYQDPDFKQNIPEAGVKSTYNTTLNAAKEVYVKFGKGVPQTGDDNNMMLWGVLGLSSILAGSCLIIWNRSRRARSAR